MTRTSVAILTLAAALALNPTPSARAGDFQDEVDTMLGDMTNITTPGAWESTRRGVISGGGVSNRSRLMDPNIVSFRPPEAEAGCGGIDLYSGSFSFINEDQLVQLLRSIASNAKGYAFQLALEGMCQECSRQIEAFQKKVQELNQHFGDSCQMAQGIVNDVQSAYTGKQQNEASIISSAKGAGDVFQSWSTGDGNNPKEAAETAAPGEYAEQITGNIVWRHLTENNAGSWFSGSSSTELREALMTVTGTVVVSPVSGSAGKTTKSTVPAGNITLEDLVTGGTIDVYDCGGTGADECLNVGSGSTKSIDLTGFAEQIEEQLLGSGSGAGIIAKWANNTGSLSAGERDFVSSLPRSMGGMIQRLSSRSPSAARSFVATNSRMIGLDMAFAMLREMITATNQAIAEADHSYTPQARDLVEDARSRIHAEHEQLVASYGAPSEVREHFLALQKVLERQTDSRSLVTN